jgi:hypothetical protein
MSLLIERLAALPSFRSPVPLAKRVLASVHGGEAFRHALPQVMRAGAIAWLFVGILGWLFAWAAVYEEFERWGLVRTFVAQMLWLLVIYVLAKITMLRAGHLRLIPADDFVSLRAAAVLCRWLAEVLLVQAVGTALVLLIHRDHPLLSAIMSSLAPSADIQGGEVGLSTLLVSGFMVFWFLFSIGSFFFLYAAATAIDVYLAIEFNTRPERVGKQPA